MNRFTSFEGNTGPYILYTIVRIKSILRKHGDPVSGKIRYTGEPTEKAILLLLSKFAEVVEEAYEDLAPHKICSYIFDLANAFNAFYHDVRILSEEDKEKKDTYLSLLVMVQKVLEQCIDLLGFKAPERM